MTKDITLDDLMEKMYRVAQTAAWTSPEIVSPALVPDPIEF